jgi:Ca-activated chloride channel family protein
MRAVSTLLALSLIWGARAIGQAQDGGDVQLGTTLVNTFITVTDKEGRFISDLNPSDFVIWDEGRRQKITEFSRETQLPLTLALVVDRSRSVQERFELERAAAIRFLESILRKGHDRGLLTAFDSTVYLIHDFTDDADALSGLIQHLSTAGNSAIFDAVYKTARSKFSRIPQGRKVIVLITDGDDTASRVTLQQAIDMALRTDVIIYPIGIRGTKAGISNLNRLAQMTGGRSLFLDEAHPQLADLFAQLQEELRNQYSIGYQLDQAPDNRFHRLRIRVKKRGLSVRARVGYYALAKQEQAQKSSIH